MELQSCTTPCSPQLEIQFEKKGETTDGSENHGAVISQGNECTEERDPQISINILLIFE
jgi:hypothetical protein